MEHLTGQPENLDSIPEATHPTKTTKVLNKVIVLFLVIIALGLGVILRWSFQDENVLQVKNSPFPAQIIHSQDKQVIILTADYCKNSNLEGTLRTSFVSETREVFQPVTKERLQKGCNKVDVPVVVPIGIPPDTYKIKFRATYDVNPLKKGVVVEFESRPVKVESTQ